MQRKQPRAGLALWSVTQLREHADTFACGGSSLLVRLRWLGKTVGHDNARRRDRTGYRAPAFGGVQPLRHSRIRAMRLCRFQRYCRMSAQRRLSGNGSRLCCAGSPILRLHTRFGSSGGSRVVRLRRERWGGERIASRHTPDATLNISKNCLKTKLRAV